MAERDCEAKWRRSSPRWRSAASQSHASEVINLIQKGHGSLPPFVLGIHQGLEESRGQASSQTDDPADRTTLFGVHKRRGGGGGHDGSSIEKESKVYSGELKIGPI